MGKILCALQYWSGSRQINKAQARSFNRVNLMQRNSYKAVAGLKDKQEKDSPEMSKTERWDHSQGWRSQGSRWAPRATWGDLGPQWTLSGGKLLLFAGVKATWQVVATAGDVAWSKERKAKTPGFSPTSHLPNIKPIPPIDWTGSWFTWKPWNVCCKNQHLS